MRSGESSGTIVGVTSADFDFPRDVDLFVPLRAAWPTVEKQPRLGVFRTLVRLAPGVTPEAASARLAVLAKQLAPTLPPGTPVYGARIIPLLQEVLGPARRAIWLLSAAVLMVLVIGCVNVANLLLARATARSHELGVRSALGADRGRLIRLLLGESAVLAGVAGVLGFGLALLAMRVLIRLAPPDLPQISSIRLDVPVLLFGLTVCAATVLLFGLAPALIASGAM